IDHPGPLPAAPTGHGQRVMGTAPRTVAVAVGVEDRLELLFQKHCCFALGHPGGHVGHAEGPYPCSMVFRYLHGSHRSREVAPRTHAVPELVEVVGLVSSELLG